jgi:hypothetical protein
MTIAPPESSGPAGASPGDGETAGDPEAPTIRPVVRQRAARRRRQRRRLLAAQGVTTALFVVGLVALVWVGWSAVLRITGGGSPTEVGEPDEPGYVAEVNPTGVTLLAFTDPAPDDAALDDAALDDAASSTDDAAAASGEGGEVLSTMLLVIERNGDQGSTIVPIPALTTLWDFEESPPDSAANVFASGGIDVLRLRLGADLTFGTTAAATAPASMIDELVSQVGPITLSLPDDVLQGTTPEDATVRWAAGPLTLEPGQVAEFMSFFGLGESETNRALRVELAWQAIVDAVAAAGDPPELEADGEGPALAAELLSSIGAEDIGFDLVPMAAVPLNVSPPATLYRIDQPSMPSWVAAEVPFPIAAYPGQRARVALLNGSSDDDALVAAAPLVVGAGGEISFTGNAESFDVPTTRVEYRGPEARTAAESIAAALGVSATEADDVDVDADVVVVVGADRATQE